MRQLILILALALLISSAGAIKWSGIDLREDANVTLDDGFVAGTGGIIFNGTAPTTTEGVLYSSSGVLKFGDEELGASSLPPYTAIIEKEGSNYVAYWRNGTQIASSAMFNTTFNRLMWSVPTGKKTIYLNFTSASIASPCYLNNYTEIVGIARPEITITSVNPIFIANSTAGTTYSYIKIRGLKLIYDGATAYNSYHIYLYNTSYSTVDDVFTALSTVTYSANNRGGVRVDGIGGTAWLNRVINSHLTMIVMAGATDNWIDSNTVCSWDLCLYAIRTYGACNNLKILNNHIIIPGVGAATSYGIYNGGATSGWLVSGNWFEPQDGYTATERQVGLITVSGSPMTNCRFIGNSFSNLGSMGLNFDGGVSYSQIDQNNFVNCNYYNDSNYRCISSGSGSYNTYVGNIGYNDVSTTKAPFIYGADYSSYSANIVYGKFSDDIYNAGTGSVEAGTVATLT